MYKNNFFRTDVVIAEIRAGNLNGVKFEIDNEKDRLNYLHTPRNGLVGLTVGVRVQSTAQGVTGRTLKSRLYDDCVAYVCNEELRREAEVAKCRHSPDVLWLEDQLLQRTESDIC